MRAIEPIINLERESETERERERELAFNISPLTFYGQWAIRPVCCECRGMVQVAVPLQGAHTGISVPEKACVCVREREGGPQWERLFGCSPVY